MNPKDIVWQMMRDIDKMLKDIQIIMDEYLCDIDDGYDWIQMECEEE